MDTSVDKVIAPVLSVCGCPVEAGDTGGLVMGYGFVTVFLLIGFLKFTAAEAAGIQPPVVHSPLMSWM